MRPPDPCSEGSMPPREPSEQGSGGRIAVRVSNVRRGTTLHVGDKVEYAIGRKGDARFALDVMVYAPAAEADEESKDGAVVTLANLNYDTKRYDLKEHIGSIVGKSFGRVELTAKGKATVGFRTLAQAEAAAAALDGTELAGRALAARVRKDGRRRAPSLDVAEAAAPASPRASPRASAAAGGRGRGAGRGRGRG